MKKGCRGSSVGYVSEPRGVLQGAREVMVMATRIQEKNLQELWSKIKDIRITMMVTEEDGTLRSRPMYTQQSRPSSTETSGFLPGTTLPKRMRSPVTGR